MIYFPIRASWSILTVLLRGTSPARICRLLGVSTTRMLARFVPSYSSRQIVTPSVFRPFFNTVRRAGATRAQLISQAPEVIRPANPETIGRWIRSVRTPDLEMGERYVRHMRDGLARSGYVFDPIRCDHHVVANIFRDGAPVGSVTRMFTREGAMRRMDISWVGSSVRGLGNKIFRLDYEFARTEGLFASGKFLDKSRHLFAKHFPDAVTGLSKQRGFWVPSAA